MNPREERAFEMIVEGKQPVTINKETFIVPSQTSKKKYVVTKKTGWKCNCPDFTHRHNICKHIYSIELWQKLRNKMEDVEEVEIDIKQKQLCPYCKSEELIKRGIRKTSFGEKQRFSCKSCHKRFVLDPIQKIKGDGKLITVVMDLHFKGMSFRQIKDHLNQFYGVNIAHNTIMSWVKKFAKIIDDYTENLKVEGSGEWNIDETVQFFQKHDYWVWNIMDKNTKFLLGSHLTRFRLAFLNNKAFKKAKNVTKEDPDVIRTDGFRGYPMLIRENFPNAEHISKCGIDKKKHNSEIERLNGSQKDRTKNMRGFNSMKGGQEFHDGWRTYYNFVRPHQTLQGLTPSQLSGLNLKLGQNKWLGLLEKALS